MVDADGAATDTILESMQPLLDRIRDIPVPTLIAAAKWHLEAWFFADAQKLRTFLGGRDLGSVDTSDPDGIENPSGV